MNVNPQGQPTEQQGWFGARQLQTVSGTVDTVCGTVQMDTVSGTLLVAADG